MIKISGEFDDGDDEYGADYDPNDVDSENDPEISNDNDQDYDPDNITEIGEDYDPFKEYEPKEEPDDESYDPFKEYEPKEDPDDEPYDPFKEYEPNEDPDEKPYDPFKEYEPKEEPDDESYDPFKEYEPDEDPDEPPEEINNPSNSDTVTVVEPEQTEQGQEHEQEEKPEEFELVTPEGEPERPGEPPEVTEIRADLEEWGYQCEPDEDYTPPELDQDSEKELESEPDTEAEQKSEISPEKELEKEPEQASECEWELIDSETGEPVPHQPNPDAIPLEDLIEGLADEQQKNSREETGTEPEQEPEMEFNNLLKQEEKEVSIDDQELKIEEELEQEGKIKEEIESQETKEEFKESLQEFNLEKLQESKEKIQDTEKDNYEVLKDQYHQETGRRAIYAEKETKRFIEWKERKEEKQELDKKSKKEIQELKEESVKYLISSIKEAVSNEEISEKTSEELIELLKEYDKVYELFKKLQNRKIVRTEFEQEIEKIEKELGEKLRMGKLLFKDFEGFRRDYNEIVRRAGKRVAMLQISHKTNRFLLNISQRLEQFKKEGISQDSLEKNSVSQEWAIFLKDHIEESTNQEISKEIKEELQFLINQVTNNNKILIKQLKEHNPRFDDFFKELKRSLAIYKEYKSRKYEKSLIHEGKRVAKKIAHQLTEIKKKYILQQIFNENNPDFQNLKDILKENLYNNTSLNLKEKSTIIKIIQKDKLSKEDKTKLKSVLSKLPTKDLISLLGEDFKKHIQNYLRWGSDYDLIEEFLHYIQKSPLIKQLITEFNSSGNWMKNFRPTKTFLYSLLEKQKQLMQLSKDDRTSNTEDQIIVISNFSSLITKIRENDTINKVIKAMILENPGKYNAYDIQKWLLLSDTSVRNQLKRIFTEDEYQHYIRTQKHVTLDTIRKVVTKKGGKCHTKTLKNAKSKLHLECSEGHHFFTTYNSVVYANTWCPDCNIYVSETICRRFFERIFKRPFPKSYPKWLINENGNQMELDGYNKDLGLAFEYQGIQHRKKAFNKTENDLKNIQKDDDLKLKLCNENGVILLQIPDDEIIPYNKMQEYIENEYERKTGKTLKNIPRYDYQEFAMYENKYAKKFRVYVEKKDGSLMTPYFSARKEVTLMCENGHYWKTTPNSVYQDNWCPECAGNMKGTTEYFRKIGREFNCELISDYINAKELLWYKCPKGHKFKKTPYWLKRIYKEIEILCPECKMDRYAEKFKAFINKKKGYLLTPYKGRFKPIKIKCKNNHVWETTPAAVYQGSWCKTCKKKN